MTVIVMMAMTSIGCGGDEANLVNVSIGQRRTAEQAVAGGPEMVAKLRAFLERAQGPDSVAHYHRLVRRGVFHLDAAERSAQ